MAKMVTRTVEFTKVSTFGVDTETAVAGNKDYLLSGVGYTPEKALKAIAKAYPEDTFKAVQVITLTEEAHLYGMTEETFLKYADVLPDRKVKEN